MSDSSRSNGNAAIGLSQAVAEFVVRTEWEDIPQVVRHEAKRSLVNFFATSLAGCREPALLTAGRVFARFQTLAPHRDRARQPGPTFA